MTPDERNLLLLLAKMLLQTREHVLPGFDPKIDRELQRQIARIEAAEDRAADEEQVHVRG